MAAAFGWGTLAASLLVIGALVALRFRISLHVIGLILAFGAGVLISAVAFDLVEEAISKSHGRGAAIAGLFAGCVVFFGGDWLIDRFGGADRKDADGGQANGSALAIVLGTVLDGIPESMVIGLTIFQGGAVGAAYLTAVFISNLPESISSTSGLRTGGWKKSRILWMWIAIAVISGLASLAGYGLFQHSSPGTVGFVLAFAAGAILTMLADTMMPEAHQHGGKLVGVVTTLGFAIAATIHLLDWVTGRDGADSGSPPRRVGGSHEEQGRALGPGPSMCLLLPITRSCPPGARSGGRPGTATVTRGQTDRPADPGCST